MTYLCWQMTQVLRMCWKALPLCILMINPTPYRQQTSNSHACTFLVNAKTSSCYWHQTANARGNTSISSAVSSGTRKFEAQLWSSTTLQQQQQQQQQQPFYGPLSRTTQMSRYQKKHSPTHHPDHHPIFISFFHLPWSIASSLFKLCAWQSFAQPLSTSFLVYLLVWSPPPHIPYISSSSCTLSGRQKPPAFRPNSLCFAVDLLAALDHFDVAVYISEVSAQNQTSLSEEPETTHTC